MNKHDTSYKRLFSHPQMVEDLLRGFVHESWVNEIDFSTLETVKDSFISDDLRARYDDIIWKVRWQDTELYLFLLLEFQSTIDRFMAVRLTTYSSLLYQHLVTSKQYTDTLPPVFAIVIYNGTTRWNEPTNVRDLIVDVPNSLDKYLPQLEFLLLDESRYNEAQLRPMRNFVAALFRLENSRSKNFHTLINQLRLVLIDLIDWLKTPEHSGLRRDFMLWLRRVLLPARLPNIHLPEMTELQEMNTMLYETVQEMYREAEESGMQRGIQRGMQDGIQRGMQDGIQRGMQDGIQRGMQDGIQKGLQQGMEKGVQKGQAQILLTLLEAKFGVVNEKIRTRLENSDSQTLDTYAQRLLAIESLDDLFDGITKH